MISIGTCVELLQSFYSALKNISFKSLWANITSKSWGWYEQFRIWFFGELDIDKHEELVRAAIPAMAQCEDRYASYLNKELYPSEEDDVEPIILEDCLELVIADSFYDRADPTFESPEDVTYKAIRDTSRGEGDLIDPDKVAKRCKVIAGERRKVKKGCLKTASKLLASIGKNKHDLVEPTKLDRLAVMSTLNRECAKLNIVARDAEILCNMACWQVMTPSLLQLDSVANTWNPETAHLRNIIEARIGFGSFASPASRLN